MARPIVIAANWKMHKTRGEAQAFMLALEADLERVAPELTTRQHEIRVVVAPPFTAIAAVAEKAPPGVDVYAQDVHQAASGAYTGEVSAAMLIDVGASGVILGHSERRQMFGESDAMLTEKVASAIDGGLRAMLCVGETLDERDRGEAELVVGRQLDAVLARLGDRRAEKLEIAYEPVWAIGTGRTATPGGAQAMHRFIRGRIAGLVGIDPAARIPVLYGGSVNPDNAAELLAQHDIDGGLIGGASLEVDSFAQIVAAGNTVHAAA